MQHKSIQLFQSCESNVSRRVDWQEMYDIVRGDTLHAATDAFRHLRSIDDVKAEKKCKASRFPAMLPACYCKEGGRKKDDIIGYTGYAQADFDRLSAERVEEIMLRIKTIPEVIFAFRSMSGRGVHVYYQYVEKSAVSQREADLYIQGFRQGNEYLSTLLCADYDTGTEPAVHPSSLCHDPDAYFNPGAHPFVVDMSKPIAKRRTNDSICRTEPSSKDTVRESTPWSEGEICEYAKGLIDRYDSFREGNRHNYLVKLIFLLSDYGVSEHQSVTFISFQFPDYKDENIDALVASCYRYVSSSFGSHELPKRLCSQKRPPAPSNKHSPQASSHDDRTKTQMVEDFLNRKKLRYDVISRKVQIEEGETGVAQTCGAAWSDLTDRDMNTLWRQCNAECGVNIPYQVFRPVLMSDIIPSVNPLVDYVDSLPEWNEDMPDYIGEVARMVKVESSNIWEMCFRKWFTAMVASWLNPGVANHQVLVLIGEQGIYKTTWLDAIMPPELAQYRSKQSGTDKLDKDEQLRSAEFGLINLDEIDKMNERELNALKSLITTSEVNVRAPYGYGKERRVRIASYVASGNKDHFLTDTTGNRRWLPFRVQSIESPYEHPFPYEGMYSQARYYIKQGYDYWFSSDDIELLSEHVDSFMVETNEEQLIPIYFRPASPGTQDAVFLTLAEISAKLSMYGNIRNPMDLRQLGATMKKLGFQPMRRGHTGTRGYIMIENSADAINSQRRLDAIDACKES